MSGKNTNGADNRLCYLEVDCLADKAILQVPRRVLCYIVELYHMILG